MNEVCAPKQRSLMETLTLLNNILGDVYGEALEFVALTVGTPPCDAGVFLTTAATASSQTAPANLCNDADKALVRASEVSAMLADVLTRVRG